MSQIGRFRELVAQGLSEFTARHPGPFLLRRGPVGSGEPIAYRTAVLQEGHSDAFATDADLDEQSLIIEIKKRDGNPFPDRISIGRANNCDIVLRYSFVSKLHAHLLVRAEDQLELVDNNSANGTRHNGVVVAAGSPTPLALGDQIGLGPFELELVDASRLYELLAAAAIP